MLLGLADELVRPIRRGGANRRLMTDGRSTAPQSRRHRGCLQSLSRLPKSFLATLRKHTVTLPVRRSWMTAIMRQRKLLRSLLRGMQQCRARMVLMTIGESNCRQAQASALSLLPRSAQAMVARMHRSRLLKEQQKFLPLTGLQFWFCVAYTMYVASPAPSC